RDLGGTLRLHVPRVLLDIGAAAHAAADDVEHGEYTGLGTVDDLVAEFAEVAPAGAAGVDDSGHAAAKGEAIGADAIFADIFAAHAAGEDVHVHVDQSRTDIEAGNVDGFARLRAGNVGCDSRDLALGDGYIPDRVEIVPGVDDVAALEQQIILRLAGGCRNEK